MIILDNVYLAPFGRKIYDWPAKIQKIACLSD